MWSVIWYVAAALGIPGNFLSAIVWLRRHIVVKSSSSVYLAALAINDLAYLLIELLLYFIVDCSPVNSSLCLCVLHVSRAAVNLEPLLVLGFSVERLISIVRPLQLGLRTRLYSG